MQLCAQEIEHDLFTCEKGELATDTFNKITIGQSLKQLAASAGFSGDLALLLTQALAERNHTLNYFYNNYNFRWNSDESCAKKLEHPIRMHKTILKSYKAVMGLF